MGGTATTPVLCDIRFYTCRGRDDPNSTLHCTIRSSYTLRAIRAIVCVKDWRVRVTLPMKPRFMGVSSNGDGSRPRQFSGYILSPIAWVYELSISTCSPDCRGQLKISFVSRVEG